MISSSHKHFYQILFASCILCLSLGTTLVALAEYQPPPNPSAPKSPSRGTGAMARVGGCSTESEVSLTALAPHSHVGQTISTSPTVAWFVPDTDSFPLKFYLYEYEGNSQRQILEEDLQSSPGIMKLSLSNLSVGKRYRWQLVLSCYPDSSSRTLLAGAEIEVVPLSPTLQSKLGTTTDSLAKANLYAENGLWYDAFGESLAVTKDLKSQELRLNLLGDLANLETNSPKTKEQGVELNQIVQVEREFSY
ncbi:MAG TPA: hypothetical protein DEG17_09180 [Cyanobacteria bacterium UBA11149]|nr:hypothetical protein [Cyanobacteria bacterium UBA11149]